MLDQDFQRLVARDGKPLDDLEADIWRRETETLSVRAATRKIASWQAAVAVIAIICSASFGAASAISAQSGRSVSLARSDLSPAALLLGGSR